MAISKELWIANTRILCVEAAYWIISIGMVFINKFVLSANILTDDLTVFITIFQILFSLSILITLNHINARYLSFVPIPQDSLNIPLTSKSNVNDEVNHNSMDTRNLEKQEEEEEEDNSVPEVDSDSLIHLLNVNIPGRINLETCKLVLPLSILYIGMLLLNNFCLKYVGVAFYFVSRSLTTVFNVTFTYFLINESVSYGSLVCCAFIVLGFILGIDQENVIGSLSVIGVAFGVASSLFTSLFSIYTKKTLMKLDKNIWVLVMYNNINAILLCTPLLVIHGDIQALVSDKVVNPSFWFLLSVSGVVAFFISIVTNASIKYTSPLTHNISGTAKACFQTVIAVMYYHEHKSALWWISNVTILIASAAYSFIKQREMERKFSSQAGSNKRPKALVKQTHRRESTISRDSGEDELFLQTEVRDSCSVKVQTPSAMI